MDSLIAENVSRSYGGSEVVSNASLSLEPGKLTALLGGSGAGKSTLLRLMAGLESVHAGEIRLGNTVLSSKSKTLPAEKRRIGLVFQDFALFPHMTATQNVRFGLKHLSTDKQTSLALEWLARMNLSERKDAYPHEMSGGEQQRVAIARALAPEPKAILLDEPFSGLDPALREDVRRTALDAVKVAGIPALLVTHDAEEAMTHADHLAVMRRGAITQQGTPDEVYTNPIDYETATALGPANKIETSSSLAALLGANSAVREEGVRLDPDGPVRGVIISARRVGAAVSLKIDIEGHGPISARARFTDAKIGDAVKLSFDPRCCFRFG